MHQPLFSILTTVYNREDYITDAIESVLKSSCEGWELILVDDCSADNSHEICKEFAGRDSRIRVYRNSTNLGDYPNRNQAASYARGKYLKYVDSDDAIFPYTLDILKHFVERYPHAALLLAAAPPDRIPPFELSPRESLITHFNSYDLLSRAPGSALISKQAFDDVGGFPNVRHFGDSGLWLKLAAKYGILAVPPGWNWNRTLKDSEKIRRRSTIKPIKEQLESELEFLSCESLPLSFEERKQFGKRLLAQARRAAIKRFIRTRHLNEISTLAYLFHPRVLRKFCH